MVDDSKEKVERNYGNAIIVSEFNGDPNDGELAKLIKYLETIGPVENVRAVDKIGWRSKL